MPGEEALCSYVNLTGIFDTTVTPDKLYIIETIFNPNDHLKTGLPGRPRKINIILRSHIRKLKRNKEEDTLPLFKREEMYSHDPTIRCFYEILSHCDTREMMYKCWPSLSSMSGISCQKPLIKPAHPYQMIHKTMFTRMDEQNKKENM